MKPRVVVNIIVWEMYQYRARKECQFFPTRAAQFTTRLGYQRYGVVIFFSQKLRPLFLWKCGTKTLIKNPNTVKGEDKVEEYWTMWAEWQEKHDPETTSYEWLEKGRVMEKEEVGETDDSWEAYDELRMKILEAVSWDVTPSSKQYHYQAEALHREEGPSLACEKCFGEESTFFEKAISHHKQHI